MSRITEALERAGKTAEPLSDVDAAELAIASFAIAGDQEPALALDAPLAPPSLVPFAFEDAHVDRSPIEIVRADERTIVSPKGDPVAVQQYRKLASTLHQLQVERQLRCVLITSAVPAEGKTLTAVNLSLTFSESFRRRVLLIDGDLRKPSIGTLFGLEGTRGLSNVLRRGAVERVPVVPLSERLSVLTSGRRDADPVGAFTSQRMHDLLRDARESYDWIVIDSPPVGLVPDAVLLSMMADGVLMVVRASSTRSKVVQRAIAAITPERLIGAVLNRTDKTALSDYGYYQAYGSEYGYVSSPDDQPRP